MVRSTRRLEASVSILNLKRLALNSIPMLDTRYVVSGYERFGQSVEREPRDS